MSGPGIANPLGALAFLALAVLVLLYLRSRRRQAIPVATLFLWRRVRAPLVEHRSFRPDLLFWLQAAILAALAAACLRPYLERAAGAAPAARLLVLLDVSASMQARELDGVRFDLARARVQSELAGLPAGDEVMIVTAGARTSVGLRWSTDRALARSRLEEITALDVPTDLTPALELALAEARVRAARASSCSPTSRRRRAASRPRSRHGRVGTHRADGRQRRHRRCGGGRAAVRRHARHQRAGPGPELRARAAAGRARCARGWRHVDTAGALARGAREHLRDAA
jgi:hypothetical protein